MNVDRLPESDSDPRPAADTTHLTEPPQPETAAPAKPKPEREHDQLLESPTGTAHTDSPAPSGNASEPAEPRSRQEHADLPCNDEREVSAEDEVEEGDTTVADEADTPPDDLDMECSATDVTWEEEKADSADDRSADSPPDDLPRKERETSDDARASEGLGSHDEEHADPGSPSNGEANNPSPNMQAEKPPEPATDAPVAHDRPPPLTDKEWSEHVTEVREILDKARAAGLESHLMYTIDPDHQAWSKDRRAAHDLIINDLYYAARDVPNQGYAVVAGGLGGAGKTTVLGNHEGIDPTKYLTINPDDLKEELAQRGMIPKIDGLSPMEASDLVHEESAYLARQLALRAQHDGKNIIWDITMSAQKTTEKRISDLRNAGYSRIDGLFIDIPVETSIKRTEARHRLGHDQYRAGEGLGGRYLPPEVIQRQIDSEWSSRNRRTFESVKHNCNDWSIYDNSIDGRRAVLRESSNEKRIEPRRGASP